jgi:hypothetical protein
MPGKITINAFVGSGGVVTTNPSISADLSDYTTLATTASISGSLQPYHVNLDDISNINTYGIMVRTNSHGGTDGYNLIKPSVDSESLSMIIPYATGYTDPIIWKVNDYISKTEVADISGGLSTRMDNFSSSALTKTFTSAGSFSIGNIVRYNGTTIEKALANNINNATWCGVVTAINGTTITVTTNGTVTGLSGLTAGTTYYLSPTSSGEIINYEPTTAGLISAPVFIAFSTTEAVLLHYRPFEVGSVPTVTGSRGGNAALASLITTLANQGLIIDGTTT